MNIERNELIERAMAMVAMSAELIERAMANTAASTELCRRTSDLAEALRTRHGRVGPGAQSGCRVARQFEPS